MLGDRLIRKFFLCIGEKVFNEGKVLILQQIISIQGEASLSSCRRTGFRKALMYGATPPPRRVWTRSALKTVKLLTDGVSHVSVKSMIVGSLEDKQIEFGQLGVTGAGINQ